MVDQLPGLKVHINEARVTGTFELPPADMQHISYQGRNVIVLVADVMAVTVKDTKDGDTKASWTFKGVDAAIVRDDKMKTHLANALYLDGVEGSLGSTALPPVSVSDDESEEEDDYEEEVVTVAVPEERPLRRDPSRPAFHPPAQERVIRHSDPLLEEFLNARM